jgi:hypothetical protein
MDDLVAAGASPFPLPGSAPTCSDAEPLAIALMRHLLGRRSEPGFLDEVQRDWAHLFPPCRIKASPANGSAGCGARLSCSAATWPFGCPRMAAADRHLRAAGQCTPWVGWAGPGNDLAARLGPQRRAHRIFMDLLSVGEQIRYRNDVLIAGKFWLLTGQALTWP